MTSDNRHNRLIAQSSRHKTADSYVAVLGKGMLKNNTLLPELIGYKVLRWYPWYYLTKGKYELPNNIAGWGHKKSFYRAKKTAKKLNARVLCVEDGFLRSINSGINSRYGCSVVVDNIGIYFDQFHSSKLEHDISKRIKGWSNEHDTRAELLINTIIKYRLSKYNSTLDCPELNSLNKNKSQNKNKSEHVLVIDQVQGDASIKGAGANKKQFEKMLKTACKNHPHSQIWIKAHPAGKTGYLNTPKVLKKLNKNDRKRVAVIDSVVNPISLIRQCNHVYCVSSHMGFEALLLKKPVYCFGVAWYTGWGLTHDAYAPKKLLEQVISRRINLLFKNGLNKNNVPSDLDQLKSNPLHPLNLQNSISIKQLFYAAYIDYSRYVDPASKQSCEIEQVIQWLNTNRNWYLKLPSKITVIEFSRWKKSFVSDFLSPIKNKPNYSINYQLKSKSFSLTQKNFTEKQNLKINSSHDILVWGLANRKKLTERLTIKAMHSLSHPMKNQHIWCMEDGFIRSNGLGATLLAPLSVVIDEQGIYYDATKPSDLENLIAQCSELDKLQLDRVNELHKKLLNQRVSKYHVGKPKQIKIPETVLSQKKPIILVVGQVEDDLSVKYCGSQIISNSGLIRNVRAKNPNGYLIYKPHPDVEAGLRLGKVSEDILTLVDDVAYDVAMPDCLDIVEEVHTISSLTGFEALIRGKKVSCHGVPFYAGWGLTTDLDADVYPKSEIIKRRYNARNKLTLEQLIYCVLIEYPLYRLPDGHGYAQVEQVIDFLYPINSASSYGSTQALNNITNGSNIKSLKYNFAKKAMQLRYRFKNGAKSFKNKNSK